MFSRHSFTNTLMAIFVLSTVAAQGYTQDQTAEEARAEKKKQQIIQGLEIGGGPFMVEKNDSGEITSAAFVGGNRISTVFGVTKGKELARSRAVLKAKAQFSKWLSEEVTVIESAGDETIVVMEGTEALDGNDSFSEVGKSIESNTSQFKTVSSAILRGLRTIGVEVVDNEMRVMLYWSKEESDAVKKLKKDLDKDEVVVDDEVVGGKASVSESRKLNKTVKPKRVIIIP